VTLGSLFSGIGGLDLGLEAAGFYTKWQVENDPFCLDVLDTRFPHTTKYHDIRSLDPAQLEPVDLIAGGFPCQDISVAKIHGGVGQGLDGSRSGLWVHFSRIVRALQPEWVLVENVLNLRKRGLGRVLGDLAESGYDAEWDILPAYPFGADHLRERLFIIAYRSGRNVQGLWPTREQIADTLRGAPILGGGHSGPYFREARSRVVRVIHGVSTQLDKRRIEAVGNAVVPVIGEFIGRNIKANTCSI
jgi:DNA (cytosine-5)-methyltransferase 1